MYRIAVQVSLVVSLLGLIGWIISKFRGSLLTIGPDGFHLWTNTCLGFAIAFCLAQIALGSKAEK
jgi:hypothetical protein